MIVVKLIQILSIFDKNIMKMNFYSNSKDDLPWIEKYRPTKITDVIYQDEIVKILEKSLNKNNVPNLLFYGPPGSGKTSAIISIAKTLFPKEKYDDRVLKLNASDEELFKW